MRKITAILGLMIAALAFTGTTAQATNDDGGEKCFDYIDQAQYKKFTAATDDGPWVLYGTWWQGQSDKWWPDIGEVAEGPGNHPDGRYTYRKVNEREKKVEKECPPEETTTTTTQPEETTTTTVPEETTTTVPEETTTTVAETTTTVAEETTTTAVVETSAPPPPTVTTPPPAPQLPETGAENWIMAVIAGVLMLGGTGLTLLTRRS
jgi:LPXTG-motif cell wall-anchored protein